MKLFILLFTYIIISFSCSISPKIEYNGYIPTKFAHYETIKNHYNQFADSIQVDTNEIVIHFSVFNFISREHDKFSDTLISKSMKWCKKIDYMSCRAKTICMECKEIIKVRIGYFGKHSDYVFYNGSKMRVQIRSEDFPLEWDVFWNPK